MSASPFDYLISKLTSIFNKQEEQLTTLDSLDAKDFSTETTLAALKAAFDAEDFATQTTLAAVLTELLLQQKDALTDAELRASPIALDDFDRLAKARGVVGEEVKFEDVTGGDLYIGAAPDGTATSAASWNIVRYYRTAAGAITRQRYRTGVVWDDRTAGWT